MAYYKSVLRADETVLFLGRLHWLIYGQGLAIFAGASVLLVAAALWQQAGGGSWLLLVVVAYLVAFAVLGVSAIRRSTTEIVVTDRRVIYKTGLVGRRTIEMNTSKIETVDVLQGVIARMLGFGTVIIRGTGSTFEPLVRVAEPMALRNAILVG